MELLKRALRLEDHYGSGDDDEFDLDWEKLSQEEKDILIAGARVDLKYRRKGPHGFIYGYEEATAEEKALRMHAQASGDALKTVCREREANLKSGVQSVKQNLMNEECRDTNS